MFGTDNSMEPVQVTTPRLREREKAGIPGGGPDQPPVREATRAEVAASERRRQAAGSDPVRPVPEKTGLFSRRKAEPVEPDATAKRHGLYMTEKRGARTYFADYQQKQEVMRADTRRISSKQGDRQTVSAMLDLAQERGWQKVRLRGTEDFKREAWVQAQVRGVATEGYKPTATDEQELARRKAARAPVDGQGERAAPKERGPAPPDPMAAGGPRAGEIPGHVKPENRQVGPEETALRQKMGMPIHRPAATAPVTITTTNVSPAEVARLRADFGHAEDAGGPAKTQTAPPDTASAQPASAKAVPTGASPEPVRLSDREVRRILADATTLGQVWRTVNDPNTDPAAVRQALEREPPADRARLTAEVMQGLERRAAQTGNRDELDRIVPHLPGRETEGTPPSREQAGAPAVRVTSDERAERSLASLSEHDARIAAITPEQRDAVSRAALGSLHPSRAPEDAATAEARQKAVWGSVEDAGKTAREAARAEAPAAKAGERAKAEAV